VNRKTAEEITETFLDVIIAQEFDGDAIAAADEHGMAMIFTGTRHFKH